ncbi:glutamate racemase [Comamonas sp. NLF-1-9]|uniref:glutamate racemase n=1 Tax=Comamonas sp. NLF-1-9 TaxID=2853163 RepID=UPI001C49368B|nr:glutamate racemase [Comamonas sp. NLF-1-9]QXL85613.1 glutamate racemase [Comamonas sp. NLF-1-9]
MPLPPGHAPIGVFDSGIGGLSVLRALREELPQERFVYLADSAHAPYGEKGERFVRQRSLAITRHLVREHAIALLVVACNTATAAAVNALRESFPQLPIVGVEPALKPAALCSRTGHVGVLATRGTVQSSRFAELLARQGERTRFSVQACDGLAQAIEQATLPTGDPGQVLEKTRALCARYISALGSFGTKPGEMDTLVLGCTHYVFVQPLLQQLAGPEVMLVETGAAVARQARRKLQQHGLLAEGLHGGRGEPVRLLTTGSLAALQAAAARWLALPPEVCSVAALADEAAEPAERPSVQVTRAAVAAAAPAAGAARAAAQVK